MNIELNLAGPYKFTGKNNFVKEKIANQIGIYIWTIHTSDGYLAYYVGETGKSFKIRLEQHISNLLNGSYQLYDPELMKQGIKKHLWNPYKPESYVYKDNYLQEFIPRYHKLSKSISEFIDLLDLFFIPMDVYDRNTRRLVESRIANHLNQQPDPIGSFQDRGIRYKNLTSDDYKKQIVIKNNLQILGLDNL